MNGGRQIQCARKVTLRSPPPPRQHVYLHITNMRVYCTHRPAKGKVYNKQTNKQKDDKKMKSEQTSEDADKFYGN